MGVAKSALFVGNQVLSGALAGSGMELSEALQAVVRKQLGKSCFRGSGERRSFAFGDVRVLGSRKYSVARVLVTRRAPLLEVLRVILLQLPTSDS